MTFMYVKLIPITGILFILFANLGVSEVQQGAQLFGVKLNLDFLVARGAEFLFNEIDNGAHLVNVLVNVLVLVLRLLMKLLFQYADGHAVVAQGFNNRRITGTKRRIVIVQ